MGEYEFSILLREGESLLFIFAGMASTASQTRTSALRIYEQTMDRDKKNTKGLLKDSQNHSQNCKQSVNIHNIY